MSASRPITEDDIQGYVDGALAAARRSEVDAYLDGHAEIALKVSRMIAQRQALRDRFSAIANEPVPPELGVRHLLERRMRPRRALWQPLAAAALLAVGGLGGWAMREATAPETTGIAALTQEAFYTYSTFGADRGRPVEMKATERADLVKWVSQRLRRPVEVPDLARSGYRFMGGRVVATANGPAGMFMYDDAAGARIAMILRPMKIEVTAPMTEQSIDTLGTISWVDGGIGYSLIGAKPSSGLHPIADEVRRQIAEQI